MYRKCCYLFSLIYRRISSRPGASPTTAPTRGYVNVNLSYAIKKVIFSAKWSRTSRCVVKIILDIEIFSYEHWRFYWAECHRSRSHTLRCCLRLEPATQKYFMRNIWSNLIFLTSKSSVLSKSPFVKLFRLKLSDGNAPAAVIFSILWPFWVFSNFLSGILFFFNKSRIAAYSSKAPDTGILLRLPRCLE